MYVNIYMYISAHLYTYTYIYIFIHTPFYTHDSQVPSCSSDSSTALKFSHGMQILSALFSHIIGMSEREGCQVTIWPSDSVSH